MREWYGVAYAAFWLVHGTVLFKGFCRYVCPLGALLAVGGLLGRKDWIARRAECGSPRQLCRVRCNYGAIDRSGRIHYNECFHSLDYITIAENLETCVPRIIEARGIGPRQSPASKLRNGAARRDPGGMTLTRRRFLAVNATASSVAAAGAGAQAAAGPRRWTGRAFGSSAEITLYGPPEITEAALHDCLRRIEDIEAEFSLHVPGSALSRLNRDGKLQEARPD